MYVFSVYSLGFVTEIWRKPTHDSTPLDLSPQVGIACEYARR
jgi:hypothetical protein